MAEDPREPEIAQALEPFQPPMSNAPAPDEMLEALVKKLLDDRDTIQLTDLPGLEDDDGTARARQTYLLSYLRLLGTSRKLRSQTHRQSRLRQVLGQP